MAESNRQAAGSSVAIACATTTNLVKVIKLKPLTASPPNLFDITFAQVGISDDARIRVFRQILIQLLPEIIDGLQEMDLSPAIVIGLVVDHVESLLAQEAANAKSEDENL